MGGREKRSRQDMQARWGAGGSMKLFTHDRYRFLDRFLFLFYSADREKLVLFTLSFRILWFLQKYVFFWGGVG